MKRRKLAALLAVLACVLLTGCGNKAVNAVRDQIERIRIVSPETISQVQAAKSAYDSLSAQEQKKVKNRDVLDNALKALEIEQRIDAIGSEVSPESEALIREARKEYDALTPEGRGMIPESYASRLDEAERSYETLLAKERAGEIDKLILEAVNTPGENGQLLAGVREKYDELTEEAKGYVGHFDLLQNAEQRLREERDKTVLEEMQRLINKGKETGKGKEEDYQGAINCAERYSRSIDPEPVSESVLQTCIHAYVLLSQEHEHAGHDEAAEQVLRKCMDQYAGTAAVNEAVQAFERHQTKLKTLIPRNGELQSDSGTITGGPGELIIRNGDRAVLVKLESIEEPDQNYLTMYVAPYETATVGVKDGEYRIKLSSGKTWYGPQERFGSGADYHQLNETVSFITNPSYGFADNTIATLTLYPGNMGSHFTTHIEAKDF